MDSKKYNEMYNSLAKELFMYNDIIDFCFETIKRVLLSKTQG